MERDEFPITSPYALSAHSAPRSHSSGDRIRLSRLSMPRLYHVVFVITAGQVRVGSSASLSVT